MQLFERRASWVWRTRFGLLLVILALLLVYLGIILYRYFDAIGTQDAPRTQHPISNTDVNPFGANFFLSQEVESWKIDRTLQMASQAGIGWAKLHFPWEEIEPRRKGEYLEPTSKQNSWAKFDRIVDACEQYDLHIVARLDRPPDWSRQDNTYKERPPDRLEDFGDFVYAFVDHYRGRIDYIQIWNEPNIFPEWGNRPVDPTGYVELLQIAYRRAKEANPNIQVLCAPLAITLGEPHPEAGQWTAMNDLQYLEELYQAGVRGYFDIYSANAFGMDRPPEDPPSPEVLNFQRVLLQREIMERNGDGDKPVWFNEYGWNAAPESMAQDKRIWQRVSEKEQAEYTLRGIEMARKEWSWAGVFMIWYFRQVGNIPDDDATYYFRMVEPDFTPRMLYFAVQDVARQPAVPGSGRYEETNPHVERYGEWDTVLDVDASGQAFLSSSVPGSSISFRFRGSALDLVTRQEPDGGRLIVSLDGQSVSGLPTNEQGVSYIELYSPEVISRAQLAIVRNANSGEHTLRITLAEEHHPQAQDTVARLDAFEVLQLPPAFPIVPAMGGILGSCLTGWLLWRTWRHARFAIRAP